MRFCRCTLPAVCVVLILSASLFAQQSGAAPSASQRPSAPAAEAIPTIVSRSELVLVPVIVTDKSGKHISGLNKDAFSLEENGNKQPISVFNEAKSEKAEASARRAPSVSGHTNIGAQDSRAWHTTIILIDTINTPFLKQANAKEQLINYLSSVVKRDEPVALLGLGQDGIRQIHPFTSDTAALVAALKKLQPVTSGSEVNDAFDDYTKELTDEMRQSADRSVRMLGQLMDDAQGSSSAFYQRDAIRKTLVAMRHIAQAYAAIPGRKTLIWASAGFPFTIDDPQAMNRMGTDMFRDYEEVWRALLASNIAIYPVDVMGLTVERSATASYRFAESEALRSYFSARNSERQASLMSFADATGGRICLNNNDLADCFSRAVEDSREYYLLGYYLPQDDRKPGWRKISVKVASPGAHVRAREGFYVSKPSGDTPSERRTQITEALASPVEYTGVRLQVQQLPSSTDSTSGSASSGKIPVDFLLTIAGDSVTVDRQNSNAVDLTVVTIALDKDWKAKDNKSQSISAHLKPESVDKLLRAGLNLKERIELSSGEYRVRFAVRDNATGQIGTVEVPLKVR